MLAQDTMFRRLRERDGAHGRWVTSGRLPGWSDTVDVEAFRDRRSRLPAEVVPRVVAAREDGMTYAAVAKSLNVDGIRPAREASAGNPSTVRAVPSSQAAEHGVLSLSLIHISEPTRLGMISYAV